MLDPRSKSLADLPGDGPPLLLVVVDTEEEFDWSRPLSRANAATATIAAQHRAQDIFDRRGVVPTYVVDYPVATSLPAAEVLGRFLAEGRCRIGAHLHPWVNPPHEEAVSPVNSYPGNLPAALERAKLVALTEAITQAFGARPTIYKAGRYGLGPATARILEDLGYEVDLSIVPYTAFTGDGGPDFTRFGWRPFWFGERRRLLEVPLTCGFAGRFAAWGPSLYPPLAGSLGLRLHAPGVAARLGLIERIRLTPEGAELAALVRLTGSLLAQGCRVFSLTYHSPSLEPGHTPYVRDARELAAFLGTIEAYLDFFLDDLGGRPTTPSELSQTLAGADAAPRHGAAGPGPA